MPARILGAPPQFCINAYYRSPPSLETMLEVFTEETEPLELRLGLGARFIAVQDKRTKAIKVHLQGIVD